MTLSPPASSQVELLPIDDPEWDWKSFERFSLSFVRAQPDVREAHLYGTRGQKQLGIDIVAELTDGRKRTYQCRKWAEFTKSQAVKTVTETEYEADEHAILITCAAGTDLRDYITGLEGWTLMDKEDISVAVCEIEPRERARRIVEDTFSVTWRRAFLGPPGPLAFWEVKDYFAPLLDPRPLLRHSWELVGRAEHLAALSGQLADSDKQVLVLVGRGGIGKTRLLRAVATDQRSRREVLIADDQVDLSAEFVEELPWTGPLVVVDDVHRRDDLEPLLGAALRGEGSPTLLLATRPHKVEELRAQLSLAGFSERSLWISEPLEDLAEADVETLARQALGSELQHLAEGLAAATADCPLVTVVGGQLLASRAVPPDLLERQSDFRQEVLERFREEMLGRLGDDVDRDAARKTLALLAALGPISIENGRLIALIAEEVGQEPDLFLSLLSQLEEAGLLRARGRLRRIVPDVLADHILHRACLDAKMRPTGRAQAMLERYGAVAPAALLRNLAELDWRIGQTDTDVKLLEDLWRDLRRQFLGADATGRLRLIELIKPAARYAPDFVLGLVSDALANPAKPSRLEPFHHEVGDDAVRHELPALLGLIAFTPRLLEATLGLLWQLARDDDRPLNQAANHPIKVLDEVATYRRPPLYARAVLDLVEELMASEEDLGEHAHSPIELVRPLLTREGMSVRFAGAQMQTGTFTVSAERTAELRSRVRAVLVAATRSGDSSDRVLAATLLGEGLRQPFGYSGQKPDPASIEQWHGDQLALLSAIEQVFSAVSDPHVLLALRSALDWHAEHSWWEDVRQRASALVATPHSASETLVQALREPINWRDPSASEARLDELARDLVSTDASAEDLADRLDAEVATLQSLLERRAARADVLLGALARADGDLGLALARWCVEHPDRPLARFSALALAAVNASDRDAGLELLRRLAAGGEDERLQLAGYLGLGTWVGGGSPPELGMLRALIADERPGVVHVALHAASQLGRRDVPLMIEVMLEARLGDEPRMAEDFCMILAEHAQELSETQVVRVLELLAPLTGLDYHAHQLLAAVSARHRGAVFDFLLRRARAGGMVQAIAFAQENGDLLAGAEGLELGALLRRLVNAMRDADGASRWQLTHLFWSLATDPESALAVILVCLTDRETELAEIAIELIREMPWQLALSHPEFIAEALAEPHGADGSIIDRVEVALLDAVAMVGDHSRSMGAPSERDVRLREQGREKVESLPAGSRVRRFYETVVSRAEASMRDDALEDEEFAERM
jgi:hypothetical protein